MISAAPGPHGAAVRTLAADTESMDPRDKPEDDGLDVDERAFN